MFFLTIFSKLQSVMEQDQQPKSSLASPIAQIQAYTDWKRRPVCKSTHGGQKASYFIYAVACLENMAFFSIAGNVVTYLLRVMHFSLADAANTVTAFLGTAFLLALPGGFISDAFISRFWTIVIFASVELKGDILLATQAHFSKFQPPKCNLADPHAVCEKARGIQIVTFYIAIYSIALGTGGIRSNLPSHGADQFDEQEPKERRQMSSFFNWFFFALTVGALLGSTVLIWIQNNVGEDLGYMLSAVAMVGALISMAMGTSVFRNKVPQGSPLTRVAQVFIAAIRNRNVSTPVDTTMLYEISEKEATLRGYTLLKHTTQFRFLDKAAAVNCNARPLEKDGNAWRICTVTQVEEVKCVIRLLPIFGSTIIMNCISAQLQTFFVEQGLTTDTSLGKHFKIPPASLPIFSLGAVLTMIPIYDRVFVPFARRITGHVAGITTLQRIGLGLALSAISMAVAAMVEVKRKKVAEAHDLLYKPQAIIPMSIFWLAPQYFTFGVADTFALVGLMEFFYSQAPPGMRSLSSSLTFISLSCGYFFSTALVSVVNKVTAKSGVEEGKGWLAGNNLNLNKLNYFYWLLCVLTVINCCNYMVWAWWFRYKEVEVTDESRRQSSSTQPPHADC